ncbi:unnamed protein product [Cunninghamella blakesleeana]
MSLEISTTDYVISPQPDKIELALKLVGLTGVTILSTLFGIKTHGVEYKFLSLSKLLVILLYVCSWAFIFSGLPIISTNNGNFVSCMLANIGCDVFYTGTKLFIYSWLIEKVWIVNASNKPRLKTKSYRFHVILLIPYIGIITFMVVTHKARIEPDGTCVVGIQIGAAYLLLIYDFIINLYMTILFVKPLLKIHKDVIMDHRTSRLQDVAKRTLIASVVCLFASFGNILILILFNAEARGAICLMCCFVDVIINVATVHWVTSQPNGRQNRHDTSDLKNTSLTTDNNHASSSQNNTTSHDTKSKMEIREDYDFNFDYREHQYKENDHHQNNNNNNTNENFYQTSLSPPPLSTNQSLTYTQIMKLMDTPDQQPSTTNASPFEEFDMKDYTSENPIVPSTTFHHYHSSDVNHTEDIEYHSNSRRSSIQESYSSKIYLT